MLKDEALQVIKRLAEIDAAIRARPFLKAQFDEAFQLIKAHAYLQPLTVTALAVFRSRSTNPGLDFEHVSQLGCAPASKVKLGRCHLPGEPVFYGANNIPTAFLEVPFSKEKPCAVVGRFVLKKSQAITLISIGEIDHIRRFGRSRVEAVNLAERIGGLLASLSHYERTTVEYIDAFLADIFRRKPSDLDPNVYEFTARLAKDLMGIKAAPDLKEVHGLIYPSVRHEGGINFAISKAAFEEKFEISDYFLTMPVQDFGYGIFEWFEHASGTGTDASGNLQFRTDPRFRARSTWPRSADQ